MHEAGHSFQAGLNNWPREERRQFKTVNSQKEGICITKSNDLR